MWVDKKGYVYKRDFYTHIYNSVVWRKNLEMLTNQSFYFVCYNFNIGT